MLSSLILERVPCVNACPLSLSSLCARSSDYRISPLDFTTLANKQLTRNNRQLESIVLHSPALSCIVLRYLFSCRTRIKRNVRQFAKENSYFQPATEEATHVRYMSVGENAKKDNSPDSFQISLRPLNLKALQFTHSKYNSFIARHPQRLTHRRLVSLSSYVAECDLMHKG